MHGQLFPALTEFAPALFPAMDYTLPLFLWAATLVVKLTVATPDGLTLVPLPETLLFSHAPTAVLEPPCECLPVLS